MKPYAIDGKEVHIYLAAHILPKSLAGARHSMFCQVEAFDKDHAIYRLRERWPNLRKWEILEELDPSHDLGKLGEKLPLNPLVHGAHLRVQ